MSENKYELYIDPQMLTAYRTLADFNNDLELAQAAGLGASTITKLVRQKKGKGFTSNTLLAICKALHERGVDINPCDLVSWKGFTPRKQKRVVKITV